MLTLALLLLSSAFGCTRPLVREKKQPTDPLLMSKKPVEGRQVSAEPRHTAQGEYAPPPLPAADFATLTAPREGPVRPARLLGPQPAPGP
jgi:hypothetical protein